jgi:hypothetical protein
MRPISITLFLVFSLCACHAITPFFVTKKDLADSWQIYENNQYQKIQADSENPTTIYFLVDADKYAGDYLHLQSRDPFVLFVNGKLAREGTQLYLNIDSLAHAFRSSQLLLGIHQDELSSGALKTLIKTPVAQNVPEEPTTEKPPTFFRDFVVSAILILLTLLIVTLRLNPKLASDYFSVTKVFSLRETDDGQIYTRINSSTNILFYFFCSLILSFYLMVIFHFVYPIYPLSRHFQGYSFFSSVYNWMELSFIILAIFFFKIILVYGVSRLFGSKDVARIHFFNWVRLLLIVFGVMAVVLFTYFILRGQSIAFHVVLLNLISWCLVFWVAIVFLKLNGRSGFSMFHLFSYICATEIIPLLIIITVLYN